jgi:hypothetical protein
VRDVVARLADRVIEAPFTWLGMSWISVPPIATLSTCMPRQMAGRSPLATAARDSSISKASRPDSAASNVDLFVAV